MPTPANRTPPRGFQSDCDRSLWNVGHLFMWSPVFEAWVDAQHSITIKPGETYGSAYLRETGRTLPSGYECFVVAEFDREAS